MSIPFSELFANLIFQDLTLSFPMLFSLRDSAGSRSTRNFSTWHSGTPAIASARLPSRYSLCSSALCSRVTYRNSQADVSWERGHPGHLAQRAGRPRSQKRTRRVVPTENRHSVSTTVLLDIHPFKIANTRRRS